MTTVIDTDALLGLVDRDDAHNAAATRLAAELVARNTTSYVLPTTLSEFALLASRRFGREQTQKVVAQLIQTEHLVLALSDVATREAVTLYQKQTSKEESLFDCYVMVAAKQVFADCIFSFDQGYRKNGFLLVEDVVV